MSAPFISPTPWTHRNAGGAETIIDGHGRTVAILTRGMEPGNGAVISKSPEMLAALRSFVDANLNYDKLGTARDTARRIIAQVGSDQ